MSKIKELRERKNFTQQEFAEKIKVSQQLVSFWESGLRKPKLNLISAIAETLAVSEIEILDCFRKTEN